MLKAEHLRKQFSTVLAVNDVSLQVQRGNIFGLIGPNGAGKSTTIRMLLNIIVPDSGKITYDNKPFNQEIRNSIGYLPEERGLYKKNKLLDTIVYFASLRGVERNDAKRKAMQWLERFELVSYAHKKVEELSKGNQQKAQFITAILHNPELVVLDEPFSGLDPVNQIVLKEIFQELKQQGKAIIFSTHQMDVAEKLCDEICLINHGRIVLEGSLSEVKKRFGKNSVRLEFNGNGTFLSSLPFVESATVYENSAELVLKGNVPSKDLFTAFNSSLDIRAFEFVHPSLNSIFLEVVGLPANEIQPVEIQPMPKKVIDVSKDSRVKKARIGILISVVIAIVFLTINFKEESINWSAIGILSIAILANIVQYIVAKKKVVKEFLALAEKGDVQ